MNSVNLIGRLGQDPEIKYLDNENQTCICTFSISTKRFSKKENKDIPNWIKCKAFGKTAENIGEYFKKGHLIGISNSELITDSWKNEQNETRSMTYVQVNKFDFLTKKEDSENSNGQQRYGTTEQPPENTSDFSDELIGEDEIPF